MAFTNSYRMERIYFEKLKGMIDILKSYLDSETDQKARAIIENGIDADGAILLLYRNLGECWAEISDLFKKASERIDDLSEKTDKYHDELNERIDEVNNYIMAIIRELTARVEELEACCEEVQEKIEEIEEELAGKQDKLTEGFGINIDANNEISVDTTEVQEKLTAGSGISIDPDTNEIENTAPGKIYTAGNGISIDSNDVISAGYDFPLFNHNDNIVAAATFAALSNTSDEDARTAFELTGRVSFPTIESTPVDLPADTTALRLTFAGAGGNTPNILTGSFPEDALMIWSGLGDLSVELKLYNAEKDYSITRTFFLPYAHLIGGYEGGGTQNYRGTFKLPETPVFIDLSGYYKAGYRKLTKITIDLDLRYFVTTKYSGTASGHAITPAKVRNYVTSATARPAFSYYTDPSNS